MAYKSRLEYARQVRGLSIEALAFLLKVPVKVYEDWENGETSIDIKELLLISDVLSISMDFLLGKALYIIPQNEDRICQIELTASEKWIIEKYRNFSLDSKIVIGTMIGKLFDNEFHGAIYDPQIPEFEDKRGLDHWESNVAITNFRSPDIRYTDKEQVTKKDNICTSLENQGACKTEKDKPKRLRTRVKIAVDERGRAVYKWANGYTEEELEAHKKQIQLEYGVNGSGKFRVIKTKKAKEDCKTFSGYALSWYSLYKAPHIRESTKEMYENCFNTHIFPAIGFRPISEITPDELQEFVLGYSASSSSLVDKIMMILRQVFNAALEDGIIQRNPVVRLKPPEGTTKERMPLTIDEANELVKGANVHEYGLLPLLLLYTGIRRGEAIGLKWEDVKEKKICIQRAVYYEKSNTVIVGETKTKAGNREIPIVPALKEALNKYRAGHRGEDYIFGNGGNPMPYTTFKRHWARLQADIPVLKGVSPHRLRHTYLMLLRHSGVDAVTQQYLMGHSDFDTTANIYTHIDNNDVSEAGNKFNNGLEELLPDYALKPTT